MSLVAWDGTILAADRQATRDDGHIREEGKIYTVDKAGPFQEPSLIAFTGVLNTCISAMNWYRYNPDISEFPSDASVELIVVDRWGLWVYENCPYPQWMGFQSCAFGGNPHQIAADVVLREGRTAPQAIRWGCQYTAYAGMGINYYSLPSVFSVEYERDVECPPGYERGFPYPVPGTPLEQS